MLGYAYQHGLVPVSAAAIERAIALNEVAVEQNRQAFLWGRRAAVDAARVEEVAAPPKALPVSRRLSTSLDELIARRVDFLTDYQDERYAQRYRALVERVRDAERRVLVEGRAARPSGEAAAARLPLTEAVARYFFKLMAYKDEYEVARLMGDKEFWRNLDEQFEGDLRVEFNLAPQIFNRRDPATGRAKKRTFGPSMRRGFALLATGKRLRGTPLDVFGRTSHRREERALIAQYEVTIDEILAALDAENHELAVEIASIPEDIRGYDLVKDAHLKDAREREAELLKKFREGLPS